MGCQQQVHFISDDAYRAMVERDFTEKRRLLAGAPEGLWAVFDTLKNREERGAMAFLYAYSPLIDMAMHDGAFFLEHVRASFRAREEMAWGKDIPEEVFRHFVLPIRGGKENLDRFRIAFYEELKERVKGCASMEAAALEINHWCRERVIYQPTNARTFSPMATRDNAYGRRGAFVRP